MFLPWNELKLCLFQSTSFLLKFKTNRFFSQNPSTYTISAYYKTICFFKYTDLVITHTDFICTPKFFLHFIQSALLQSTGFSKRYVVRFWVQVTGNQFINRSIYPMALYIFTQMECKKVAWCFYSALIYSWWYVWSYIELNVK